MPYFSWRGIDLEGASRSGKLFARSAEDLATILLKRDIAVIKYTLAPHGIVLRRSLSFSTLSWFFKQSANLIEAGIRVPQALLLIGEQSDQVIVQRLIDYAIHTIESGHALHESLAVEKRIISPFALALIRVAEESGSLAAVLHALADYYAMQAEFYKRLRKALFVPVMTVFFFIVVTLVTFLGIIPIFGGVFQSTKVPLPALTNMLLAISNAMYAHTSMIGSVGIGAVLIVGICSRWFLRHPFGARMLLWVPGLAALVKLHSLYHFFHSLSLLIKGGVPLVKALHLALQAIPNSYIAHRMRLAAYDVEHGSQLSQALFYRGYAIISSEFIALIALGEETGDLGSMLSRAAQLFRERIEHAFSLITIICQPVLMIGLGALVLILIMAIYLPVFTLLTIV